MNIQQYKKKQNVVLGVLETLERAKTADRSIAS